MKKFMKVVNSVSSSELDFIVLALLIIFFKEYFVEFLFSSEDLNFIQSYTMQ